MDKEKKRVMENWKLVNKYPFLKPVNWFTGMEISWEEYDYRWTYLDDVPTGWWRLVLLMCGDIKKQLVKEGNLENYRVSQAKEKYAGLRWHDNGSDSVHKIVRKYARAAEHVCAHCGKPDVPILKIFGYFLPVCRSCFTKNRGFKGLTYDNCICEDGGMVDSLSYASWNKTCKMHITEDCTEVNNKIREDWERGRDNAEL